MTFAEPVQLTVVSDNVADTTLFVLSGDAGLIQGELEGTVPIVTAQTWQQVTGIVLSAPAVGNVTVVTTIGDVAVLSLRPGEQARQTDLVTADQLTTREAAKDLYGKPGYEFDAANLDDHTLTERRTVDSTTQPLAFGTQHSKNSRLVLVGQKLTDGEQGKRVQVLVWSASLRSSDQSAYGWTVSHPYAAKEYPRVVWRIKVPAALYRQQLEWSTACVAGGYTGLTLVDEGFEVDKTGVLGTLTLTYEQVPGPVLLAPVLLQSGLIGTSTRQTVFLNGATAARGSLVESSAVEPTNALVGTCSTTVTPVVFNGAKVTREQLIRVPDWALGADAVIATLEQTVADDSGTDLPTPDDLGAAGDGAISSSAERVRVDRVRKSLQSIQGTYGETAIDYKIDEKGRKVTIEKKWGSDAGDFPVTDVTTVEASVEYKGQGIYERHNGTRPFFAEPGLSLKQPWTPERKFLRIDSIQTISTGVVNNFAQVGALPPDALSGTPGLGVVESSANQTTLFEGKTEKTVVAGALLVPVTTRLTEKGTVETITEETYTDGTLPEATPETTVLEAVPVADGKYNRRVGSAPVLPETKTEAEQVNQLPPEFLAVTGRTTLTTIVLGANVPLPTLGNQGLEIVSASVDQFHEQRAKVSTTTVTGTALPNGTYTTTRRNRYGLLASVVKTVTSGTVPPNLPTFDATTEEATIERTKDNQWIMTVVSAPRFLEPERSFAHPRLAHVVTSTVGVITESTLVVFDGGALPDPQAAMQPGDTERRYQQIEALVYRSTVTRVAAAIATWYGKRFVPSENVTATEVHTYSTSGGLSEDAGFLVVSSDVETLTSAGDQYRISVILPQPPNQTGGRGMWNGSITETISPRQPPGVKPSGVGPVEMEVRPKGSCSEVVTRVSIPKPYSEPAVRSIPLPRVLEDIISISSSQTGGAPIYAAKYSGGRSVRVSGRMEVTFLPCYMPLQLPVTSVVEGELWTPYLVLQGLFPSGVQLDLFGGVGEYKVDLPSTTPSAQTWAGYRGKECLLDIESSESHEFPGWIEVRSFYGVLPG